MIEKTDPNESFIRDRRGDIYLPRVRQENFIHERSDKNKNEDDLHEGVGTFCYRGLLVQQNRLMIIL